MTGLPAKFVAVCVLVQDTFGLVDDDQPNGICLA